MTQTLAILLDAYREINSKKLFWIVLIISGVVVIAFAGTGINDRGITLFGYEFQSPFNTTIIPKPVYYKYLFSNLGIGFWLTWIGMALALISTAGMFPDLIAGGSIDLYLSRPISRLRLFFTKYICGLMFVALQVAVFTFFCFLVLGIRGGAWEPKIFLSIPLVVLVFSFLFSICVLLGILTRSVVASLLLTILFWVLIFGIDVGEKTALSAKIAGEIESEAYTNQFSYKDKDLAIQKEKLATGDQYAAGQIVSLQREIKLLEERKQNSDPGRQNWITAHRILYDAKSILPKTSETNSLIDRWINITDEIEEEKRERHDQRHGGGWFSGFQDRTEVKLDDTQVKREVAETLRDRPVSWVIGTSVGFELVIVSLTAWIFCRRDF